jgi:hypothetical protein
MMALEENKIALVATQASADLKAVRTGIGAALQALYSDILREELAEGIAALVEQLDQQKNTDDR